MNKDMVEIRWHGRGGQGAKTACLLLADAAFSSGKYVQGFPEYGPERMGAPITAYNRISDERCTVHSNIYDPDYVVVVDESLIETVDVTKGLNPEGAIIVNTPKSPAEVRKDLGNYPGRVCTIDARRISEEILASGKKLKSGKDDLRSVLDDQFHKTLLALPITGIIVFTVIPIIFMILVAFTNYDGAHDGYSNLFTCHLLEFTA